MKVISVMSGKGGAGKTTTALTLGVGLMLEGRKVLFIETDPQQSLRKMWMSEQNEEMKGFFEENIIFSDCSDFHECLEDRDVDFAVIDGFPGHDDGALGKFAQIMAVSDLVLVVMGWSGFEAHGALPTVKILAEIKRRSKKQKEVRLLQTKIPPKLARPGYVSEYLSDADFPVMNTVIGYREAFVRASNAGTTVFGEKTSSSSYKDAKSLVAEVLSIVGEE